MLLRPCWTRPSCQYLNCLGPAQGCWGITNSNMLCPMSCQSPALPHCHSLPLAMSLTKLPRKHCTIINYIIIIIIIAWGYPQPRCSAAICPPAPDCHQSPASPAARAPTRPSTPHLPGAPKQEQTCSSWKCQQSQGGQKGFLSQGLPRSCCLPTSLHPSSSNLAPVPLSPEPGGNEGKEQAG